MRRKRIERRAGGYGELYFKAFVKLVAFCLFH